MKIVLLLLYLWLEPDGRAVPRLEQIPYKDWEVCVKEGKAYAEKLTSDPKFVAALFGRCIELPVMEL